MDDRERARLLAASAVSYARVALANIQREYPVAEPYYITGPGTLPLPRERHPTFFGSFDWHSGVLMHWVLVRLSRLHPRAITAEARAVLDDHFTADKLAAEAAYFRERPSFERPYGWGWTLRLAHELESSDATARWRDSFAPLAAVIVDGFLAWLPKATYPQRMGLHGNSAFALLLALEYAMALDAARQPALRRAIHEAASRWYANDAGYSAHFEPSGSDFLSPGLTEAALMSRLLGQREFAHWLDQFIRTLPDSLLEPAVVSDPSDGQVAHLHGLNLSRAYCMRLIVDALPPRHAYVGPLRRSMRTHADASLPFVAGSDYMVEHWLAAYALLFLS
jgi:hypothetical protein